MRIDSVFAIAGRAIPLVNAVTLADAPARTRRRVISIGTLLESSSTFSRSHCGRLGCTIACAPPVANSVAARKLASACSVTNDEEGLAPEDMRRLAALVWIRADAAVVRA